MYLFIRPYCFANTLVYRNANHNLLHVVDKQRQININLRKQHKLCDFKTGLTQM